MSNEKLPTKPMWRPLTFRGPWHLHDRHGMAQISEREELSLPWLRVGGDRSILDEGLRRVGEMCAACFDFWYPTQFQMADGSVPTPEVPTDLLCLVYERPSTEPLVSDELARMFTTWPLGDPIHDMAHDLLDARTELTSLRAVAEAAREVVDEWGGGAALDGNKERALRTALDAVPLRLPMTTSDREPTMSEKMDELKAAWAKLWRDLFDALSPTLVRTSRPQAVRVAPDDHQ